MHKFNQTFFILYPRLLLLAAMLCCSSSIRAAEAAGSGDATITGDTASAILEELKEIRRVLEKIEKQGGTAARPSAKPTTAKVSIKGKQSMGAEDAPVTVVEFTDYQCPYCLRFTKSTFPTLKRKYIDTGKVRWVALNLPLAFHKDATKAAQAAHCAGEQGKFWEMREALFMNPRKLNVEFLPAHAATIPVDLQAFNECLQSDRHLDEIAQDAKDANAVRLTGTPSFIIGETASNEITGQVVIGAQPVNVFDSAIGKVLEQKTAARENPGVEGNTGQN
jgi:protein-disulfide isomerase